MSNLNDTTLAYIDLVNYLIRQPDTQIIYHSYRKAQVIGHGVTMDRDCTEGKELERMLFTRINRTSDNHCVFEIPRTDRPPIAIMFHDIIIRMGTEVRVGNW